MSPSRPSRRASTPATLLADRRATTSWRTAPTTSQTRYLVSDACYFAKRTLVFGAVGPFDGYVSTFKPHERASDGTPYPSYRCLFPEAPPPGTVPNCAEVGVLGAVVGVIGTLAGDRGLEGDPGDRRRASPAGS